MVRFRVSCLYLLLTLVSISAFSAPLSNYRLPQQRFQNWSLLQNNCTDSAILQVWRQPLTGLPKDVTGYAMVAYQVNVEDSSDKAEKMAASLLGREQFNDYIAQGYSVTTNSWLVRGERGALFIIRGLTHRTTETTKAQRAEVYSLAIARDDKVIWLQIRQVCTAKELDASDKALSKTSIPNLANEVATYVVDQWSTPKTDATIPSDAPVAPATPAVTTPAPNTVTTPEPAVPSTSPAVTPLPSTPAQPQAAVPPATPPVQPEAVPVPPATVPMQQANTPATPTAPVPAETTPAAPAPQEQPTQPAAPGQGNVPQQAVVTPVEQPTLPIATPAVPPKTDTQATNPVPPTKPVTPTVPDLPRWKTSDGFLSLVLPTGMSVSNKMPYVFSGIANMTIRLYPWDKYSDEGQRDKWIHNFVTSQQDIAQKNFSQQPFQVDGATGVMVRYINYTGHTIYAYSFAKSGRSWMMMIDIQGENANLPAVAQQMMDSIKLQ